MKKKKEMCEGNENAAPKVFQIPGVYSRCRQTQNSIGPVFKAGSAESSRTAEIGGDVHQSFLLHSVVKLKVVGLQEMFSFHFER